MSVPKPDDVNDSQWKAITQETGHLLIVAGPGTGKTHTLTYRILQFIPRLKSGEKILAITFTNKASAQMNERLIVRDPLAENVVNIGTFHHFCLGLLREYFTQHLPTDFQVATPEQIQELSKELWPNLKTRERRDLLEEISLWKAKNFDQPTFPKLLEFDSHLRRKGLLDFDDLLLETVRFVSAEPNILETIRRTYPFIFVDEYQDINPIQHRLLKLLVGSSGTITAIGDPHQAIYGFRGANVKYFVNFRYDFPGAVTLSLAENYRSAQNILSASSQIIAGQRGTNVPELTAKIYAEGRLVIHQAPTDKAEAEYVVHQIEKMVGGTSMFSKDSGRINHDDQASRCFDDIVVLFRLKSQRLLLEEAFHRSGIPYQVSEERIYENPEESIVNAFKHSKNNDKVSLMTLHAAKGLEFSVVFIVGCEERLLPLAFEGMKADIDEERRLFYVGVTRAKENLFLVSAGRRQVYGKTYETQPSPFLGDIEEQLKEYERVEARIPRRKKDADQLKLFS